MGYSSISLRFNFYIPNNDVEHLFIHLMAIWVSSFVKCLFIFEFTSKDDGAWWWTMTINQFLKIIAPPPIEWTGAFLHSTLVGTLPRRGSRLEMPEHFGNSRIWEPWESQTSCPQSSSREPFQRWGPVLRNALSMHTCWEAAPGLELRFLNAWVRFSAESSSRQTTMRGSC